MGGQGDDATEAVERISRVYLEMIHLSNPRGALKHEVCGALQDDERLPQHQMHVCWIRDVKHTESGRGKQVHPHACPCAHTWSKPPEVAGG